MGKGEMVARVGVACELHGMQVLVALSIPEENQDIAKYAPKVTTGVLWLSMIALELGALSDDGELVFRPRFLPQPAG